MSLMLGPKAVIGQLVVAGDPLRVRPRGVYQQLA